MANWNRTADEYQKERDEMSNDVWIKGFRDGETKVRFLKEPGDFTPFLEHFAEGPGYFPCNEEKDCVGCTDDSAAVRKKSRKFAVNALNDSGSQQVYKVGTRLHRQLKSKQQRLPTKTICDRDYTIIRSGKEFNDISYDLEWGDPYKTDFNPDAEPLYDIGQILAAKYADAVEAYTGERPSDAPAAVEQYGRGNVDEDEKKPPAKKAAAKKAQGAKPKEEPAAAEEASDVSTAEADAGDEAQAESSGSGSYPNPDDMSNAELKEYLDKPPNDKDGNESEPVEYPKAAPRARLIRLVKEWQAEHPPF